MSSAKNFTQAMESMNLRRDRDHQRFPRAWRSRHEYRGPIEVLECRSLLSSIIGQVINDLNGNALRDVGETGVSGVTINLAQIDPSTGATLSTYPSTTTDSQGDYQFTQLPAGTYLVSEPAVTGTIQTAPSSEHTPQSYVVQLGPGNDVAGGTLASPLAPPTANWLASLAPQTVNFPLSGDFMFQLGPNGTAPTRVFLSGEATVQTQAPIVSTSTSGDGTATTDVTVNTTMTHLQLVGTVSTDQHGLGYLGTITMSLTSPSAGQITSRSDSNTLVDSSFNINATLVIPVAFGTPTVLHTSVPINFLAREIAQFPGFGGTYAHNGTTSPIDLLDTNNQSQGTLIFGSLAPTPGLDFANFAQATIAGQAVIQNTDGTTTPLVNQPIILQQTAETAGPSSEGSGQGGSSNGSGGPPAGQGPAPTQPITVYTDNTGHYAFAGLGPGSYTLTEPNGAPLTLDPANNLGLQTDGESYSIATLASGSTSTYDFVNTFGVGQINRSTAPGYPVASQTIVPNLHLGTTEFANDGSPTYVIDGVTFGAALTPGATVPMTITVVVPAGSTGYLSGWLDANGAGNFGTGNGADDQIVLSGDSTYGTLDNYSLTAGVHTLSLNMVVPAGLTLPASGQLATYARFRLSDTLNTGPANASGLDANPDGTGEVEDTPVTIYAPSQLATITGQTFEDVNGTGVMAPGQPGQDGWSVSLVNLDTGLTVATQTSGARDVTINGSTVTEHGSYQFANVVAGHYQVVATPPATLPAGSTSVIVSAPASSEGALAYQLDVTPGEQIGALPSATTPATPGWLNTLPSGTDSLFTLGQFTILQGGGGGHAGSGSSGSGGDSGSSGSTTNQPIRISVVGDMNVFHDVMGTSGLLPAQINAMQLEGLAVSQPTEGGSSTVLGPVTVTLGLFPSTGTIGPSTSGETTGDTANFTLYISIDLTALGYGVMVNTRPLTVSGSVTQMPFIDTILQRSGGGSPIPLRNTADGTEPLRLVSASFTTMFGLDQGSFYPGTISGTSYKDMNKNNQQDSGEPGLAGATILVQQASTEGSSSEGNGNGNGGQGGSGNGETTTPTVYITQADAQGNWSISDLGPGTYTVTEIPPFAFGLTAGASFSYTVTMTSQGQFTGNAFANYPINQAPVIVAPTSATTLEDTALTFSTTTGEGISVSDADAGTNPVQVSISTADGSLSLADASGLTFLQGSATGSSQIVATGMIDAINTALAGLTLSPTAHFNGPGSLTVSVDDLGNSGFGGPQTSTTTIPIAITAVADAPTLTVANARGSDGNPIPLGIVATRANGASTEVLSVILAGVPAGATLSAGTDLGQGQWQLSPQQLANLTLVAPNSGTYPLTVTATATEPSNGSTATTVSPLTLTVDNIIPQLYSPGDQTATVNDPTAINLGSLWDTATDGAWNVGINWGDSTTSGFVEGATGSLGALPHSYNRSGRFVVTITVQDKDGGSSSSQFVVTVGPTEVAQVVIGDGTAQRSMIKSLTVTFTGPVTILPGAFNLRDRLGRAVNLNVSTALVNGQTVATLTFKGPRIVGGSLWDGLYTFRIDGSHILDATTGQAVDAAINGLTGSQAQVRFRRLFGDINGDGVVNRLDMQQFRRAFGSRPRQANYVSAFDYNSNNLIYTGDQLQIRQRLTDSIQLQVQLQKKDRLRVSVV